MPDRRDTITPRLQAYARGIIQDERWDQLTAAIDRELFERWRGALDTAERELIHQEYLGFKLFSSKIRALAAGASLAEVRKGDQTT